MNKTLKKLMLSEMRCVTCRPGNAEASSKALAKAMTVNENLMSAGYTLKPADIVRLAASPSLNTFYKEFGELLGDVKAEPMYPGFPEQVMEIEEAQYRFQQMVHYFSTYGIEAMFGVEVGKGWLPCRDEQDKASGQRKEDDRLLKAKTLELFYEEEVLLVLAKRILGRRERMTLPEREFIGLALEEIAPEELEQLDIPFKENLMGVFVAFTQYAPDEQAFRILRTLCKHTGDVQKGTVHLLAVCDYHLRTSQKRFIVKLLESYPVTDFKSNLILSRKKAGQSLVVLQYLDYNVYSRSDAHKEAVRALRDGELRSWEGQARYLLSSHEDGALQFVAARPGMLLRMVAWLLRIGYPAQEIKEKLIDRAETLSVQTLVTILAYFGNSLLYEEKMEWWDEQIDRAKARYGSSKKVEKLVRKQSEREQNLEEEAAAVYGILREVLSERLKTLETPMKGKKVFLDVEEEYDLTHSELQCNSKSEEGGYIRSGIAYRIPEGVNRLRFFVYWNDSKRVDVDLHASAHTITGETVHVGWNSDFRKEGIVMSGDITHSDAAEYIDIDLTKPLREVAANINLFAGKDRFCDIKTCFVGMMAVKKLGENVKLYSPANCFFSHELRSRGKKINYGYVDVVNRCLVFVGKENEGNNYDYKVQVKNQFSLQAYLDALFAAQEVVAVQAKADAEVVLKMGKAEAENEISVIDNNYFLDM